MKRAASALNWACGLLVFASISAWAGGPSTAPTITSADSAVFDIGVAGSFTITTTGSPTPAISETGPLPPSVTFHDNGNGTATLAGTPDAGTLGAGQVTITATNGVNPDAVQTLNLLVRQKALFDGPFSATFVAGAPQSVTVYSYGVPTPTVSHTGTPPAGVTVLDNANGTFTISGAAAAGTAGTYAFNLVANNSLGGSTAVFTLTVVDAQGVPALHAWMALLAVLMLAWVGGVVLRRQRMR
jgi:hypothetical protein